MTWSGQSRLPSRATAVSTCWSPAPASARPGKIAEADPALYRNVVLTNVVGVMNGIRAALPPMLERGRGHVVVIASVSGRVTYTGESGYVASKHAAVAFAECLRQEVAADGIRVSLIEPGIVETPLIHVYEDSLDLGPGVVPLEPMDVAGRSATSWNNRPTSTWPRSCCGRRGRSCR